MSEKGKDLREKIEVVVNGKQRGNDLEILSYDHEWSTLCSATAAFRRTCGVFMDLQPKPGPPVRSAFQRACVYIANVPIS